MRCANLVSLYFHCSQGHLFDKSHPLNPNKRAQNFSRAQGKRGRFSALLQPYAVKNCGLKDPLINIRLFLTRNSTDHSII